MSPVPLVRLLLLAAGMGVATVGVGALTWPSLRLGYALVEAWTDAAPQPGPADAVATSVCAVFAAVLVAVWAWALLAVAACSKDALTGATRARRRAGVLRPRLVRLLVGGALGVGLLGGPAQATAAPTADDQPSAPGLPAVLDGLQLPDRATAPAPSVAAAAVAVAPRRAQRLERRVRVRPGDSLWSITARLLPGTASPPEIDAGWRVLFSKNRAEIGPDPDLIRPGLLLVVPPALPRHAMSAPPDHEPPEEPSDDLSHPPHDRRAGDGDPAGPRPG